MTRDLHGTASESTEFSAAAAATATFKSRVTFTPRRVSGPRDSSQCQWQVRVTSHWQVGQPSRSRSRSRDGVVTLHESGRHGPAVSALSRTRDVTLNRGS